MKNQPPHTALARWLTARLQAGIPISDAITAFAEATFGTDDLAAAIADDRGGDIESLMDLIFFPDVDLQMRFEKHWGQTRFTAPDRASVIRCLCERPMALPLVDMAARETLLTIHAPAYALESFVRRLNITWQPDPRIDRALSRFQAQDNHLSLRVRLRNAHLEWHPAQVALIDDFLAAMPADPLQFSDLLDFLLPLISDLAPDSDLFDFLAAKKFMAFQSLCKAEDFERRRQHSNMETLMMQGERAGHGSISQWRLWMRRIDRICRAMFGRTQFFQQPAGRFIGIDTKNSRDTLHQVMRVLS